MDVTLVIALAAATLSVVLFGVMVFLLAGLGAVVWRSRGEDAGPVPAKAAPLAPPAPVAAPARAFDSLDPSVEGGVGPAQKDKDGGGNLLGFFDDETASAPNLELRTELFQQSQVPASAFQSVPPSRFDASDGNDGEATEIFSASQLGSEFAEFLEEGEDATARLQKERGAS